jgi:hypothetical protein
MATEKTKHFLPAAIHSILYSCCFLVLGPSVAAFVAILLTHFLIDRYRLARYVVWVKNFMAPLRPEPDNGSTNPTWKDCKATGYSPDTPAWLAVWLLIIADNTMHLAINYAALIWLK